jgi:hypothetical protein
MQLFTNQYPGVRVRTMMPLPEAMLLMRSELITETSNENPQHNKLAKDNTN